MALAEILRSIDELKKLADTLRPIAPERLRTLDQKLRLDWNYNSNALEGNTLTLNETRMLLFQGLHMGNKLGRHYEEIELHNDVLLTLEELVRRGEPMTEVLIRNLHHQLMGNDYFVSAYNSLGTAVNVKGKPGQYKDQTNGVTRIVNGREVFVPFKTPDEVRIEMPELIDWYRTEEGTKELHPVMLAAIFHFRFVTLHPFDDGNGRMSRILMNMILMRAGYVPAIIRIEERPQYISTLAQAQDGGTIEPFIELVANDTKRSLELLVKAAKGESIEEPDDLDKEIELLKRNIKKNDTVTVDIHNQDFREKWQKGLSDLLSAVSTRLQKFNELFTKDSIEYKYLGTIHSVENIERISDFIKELKRSHIEINFEFFTYKNAGANYFDVSARLEISLDDYKYKILYTNEMGVRNNVDFLYDQVLEADTIDKIATDLAKVVLKEIKQKTNK